MLIKFFIVRMMIFEQTSFFLTLIVELSYLLIIFGAIEFIQSDRIKKILYVTVNLILTILLLGVVIYYNYYGYIVTLNALTLLDQVGTIKDSVFSLFKPIYLILFVDFIVMLVYVIIRKKKSIPEAKKNYVLITIFLLIGLVGTAINLYIQKDAEIANSVVAAEKQGILNYEILAVLNNVANNNKTMTSAEIEKLPKTIQDLKGITPLSEDQLKWHGIAENKNIIAIQLEAFQDFPIHLEVDGQEVTPFLNDLIEESLYFNNIFQQIGPGNTSDAEFLFNTSLYPSAWEASSESFGNRVIPSFPKLLKEQGYATSTAHANDVKFWNRINLYPALGFDKFYHGEFFGNEDVIGIGPSDEVLYAKVLPELKALHEDNQKFYAQFVSLSSHHPFKIPETKNLLPLPEKYQGSIVGDYLQAIHYTDQTLQQFVNVLKEEGMWEDTILVLYGDHFGLQPNGLTETDFPLLKELVGRDYSYLDQFNIPLIITVGDQAITEVNETIGSQIDIMPTVANLLGLSLEDYIHFGQDLVNYPDNLFGIRYYMPFGSFLNNEISFKPLEGFDDGQALDIHTAKTVEDFLQYEEDYDRVLKLMNLSDRYMNSLPVR